MSTRLDPDTKAKLKTQLEVDEGFRSSVYQDSLGYWTIGIGRMVDKRLGGGISLPEARILLSNDVDQRDAEVGDILEDDPVRRAVLVNMTFQMGWGRVQGFKQMLEAIGRKDWEAAARAGLDSKWAKQTPARAGRMMQQLQEGRWRL